MPAVRDHLRLAGQVDGLVHRITKELERTMHAGPVTVIATGGLAPLVIDESETIDHHRLISPSWAYAWSSSATSLSAPARPEHRGTKGTSNSPWRVSGRPARKASHPFQHLRPLRLEITRVWRVGADGLGERVGRAQVGVCEGGPLEGSNI